MRTIFNQAIFSKTGVTWFYLQQKPNLTLFMQGESNDSKWRTWFPIHTHKVFYELLQGRVKKNLFDCCNLDTKDPNSCDSSTNAKKFPPITIRKEQKRFYCWDYSLIGKSSRLSSSSEFQTVFQLSTSTPVTTGNPHPRAELPSEKRFPTQFGPRTSFL